MPDKANVSIGARVAEVRNARGLTQQHLAELIGVGHAQTVHTIESGQRALKAAELVRIARVLNVSPLMLIGDSPVPTPPVVRWREVRDEKARAREEAVFLSRCERYGFVESILNIGVQKKLQDLPLDLSTTSFKDAGRWAIELRKELGLGEISAPALRETLENLAGVKIFLSSLVGGSGAATKGEFGPAILANRAEPVERQAFSLAHELFHLLTWEVLPAKGEALDADKDRYNEQLANAFASSLLLPADPLLQRLGPEPLEGRQVMEVERIAREFGVSLPALLYRLVNLGRLSRESAEQVIENPRREKAALPPPTAGESELPGRFVTLAFQAYVDGQISIGKLAELLETTVGMLPKVLADHGFDLDADAYQAQVLSA